jgi:hypothetical protein
MWDSLESIWLAAKDDPYCDAYVVPIPYYDRMQNGTMGQMHYEGDQYPAYVPITDWQTYDMEERHPDIIFIHNPYDGGNHVTIIHPGYYSKRLKEFTDLLVYVPYFVCMDDVPEHFCACSGTMYAGKVIVQSEMIRQTYIRVFKKFEKENHCAGKFGKAEVKFVALGSPKFDKVINSKPEDFTLPDAWQRLIDGPDSTQKKTVLYNTSIEAILRGEEKYLRKVRHVLDIFRDRDDIVLWWRPHPLSEAAYQSMRPQFLAEYQQIVAEFKRWSICDKDSDKGDILEGKRPNFIYDDSSDLHRAIAWSDAYYGDGSSVVALYEITGKPIMIQNVNVSKKSDEVEKLSFFAIEEGKDCLWFTDDRYNGLFEISATDKSIKFLGRFEEDGLDILYRLSSFDSKTDKLYFAPYNAKSIAIYDVTGKVFSYVPVSQEYSGMAFFKPIIYKEYVFFTPYRQKSIMRLCTVTNTLDYYDDWLKGFDDDSNRIDDAYFLYPAVNGNKIVLASCKSNVVVEFDMDNCVSTCYKVGDFNYRYGGCCFDGENYWLTPRLATPLVKWNPTLGIIKEFAMDEFIPEIGVEWLFHPAVFSGKAIWLFPKQADFIIKIETASNSMEVSNYDEYFQGGVKSLKARRSLFAQSTKEKIYSFDNYANQLVIIDCISGKADKIDSVYSVNDYRDFLPSDDCFRSSNSSYCIENNKLLSLPHFADFVTSNCCTDRVGNINDLDGFSGKRIYDFIKKEVGI